MKKNCQRSANISGYIALMSKLFQQEWKWVWAGRFANTRPYELKKMCDYVQGQKGKNLIFGGKCGFLHRVLELEWDNCSYRSCLGLGGHNFFGLIFGEYFLFGSIQLVLPICAYLSISTFSRCLFGLSPLTCNTISRPNVPGIQTCDIL